VVSGRVVDREERTSVEGVLVLLVDSAGQDLVGRLTDEAGVLRLPAPNPGVYHLRAVRIGYATRVSDSFTLSEGETLEVTLDLSKEAIPIRGIEVEGVQACRIRPEEGLEVARVWEAVQKALTVQSWTEIEGLFQFEVILYTRDLDRDGEQDGDPELTKTEIVGRIPMQSLPAQTLLAEGFVRQPRSGVYEFLAPDAQVLLSNAFLNTHCMRLSANEAEPSLIGLSFEPAHEPEVPDIHGTLWVDRLSGQLRFLEFGYTWVPFGEGLEEAGGRLDFEPLPDGAWIVRQWWIRMPTLRRRLLAARLIGFKETGAWITEIRRHRGSEAGGR
jgi:hypothetical protein